MSGRTICLYLHAHQPFRLRHYSIFDAGQDHNYWFDKNYDESTNNQRLIHKIAEKSYRPTIKMMLGIIKKHPDFGLSLSITGTLIEQLEMWAPDVLDGFKELVSTGRVEILAETYHHSLAFFYSKHEFERQVSLHKRKIEQLFDTTPQVLRNTELSYNNDLARWADKAGYQGIITEGWDPILGWRSPNFMYKPAGTENIRLLLKNYRLSDDIAFRFSDRDWNEWPLTSEKLNGWVNNLPKDQSLVNLFMDFESLGEHQWEANGIFDFIQHFIDIYLQDPNNKFSTISEAVKDYQPVDQVDMPSTVTWADSERDLTAWLGNAMQKQALANLYKLEHDVLATGDHDLIEDWRRLQTSDHVYYMCTKWAQDGHIHAYFSPYESPYDAFLYFNNALRDLHLRMLEYNKRMDE